MTVYGIQNLYLNMENTFIFTEFVEICYLDLIKSKHKYVHIDNFS